MRRRAVTSDTSDLERFPNSPEYLTFAEQAIASWQYIAQKIKSARNGCGNGSNGISPGSKDYIKNS